MFLEGNGKKIKATALFLIKELYIEMLFRPELLLLNRKDSLDLRQLSLIISLFTMTIL